MPRCIRSAWLALLASALLAAAALACRTSADEYYARGQRALAAGQLEAAADDLNCAIEKDPRRGDAYLALAKIDLREEKWLLAVNALREARRLNPRLEKETDRLLIDGLYQLAMQELHAGNKREAIASFAELYASAPDYPGLRDVYTQSLLDYGREQILLSHFVEGVEALKEALRVDPENAAARHLLRRTRFSSK
jgi:tetratricopeptide (TPR) repeat protein